MRRNATLFVLISVLDGFGSTAMGTSARLWLLGLTGSAGVAALVGLCTYGPVFLGPWLGAVVDRLPRRPLLIAGDLVLGLFVLTLLAALTRWLVDRRRPRRLSIIPTSSSGLVPAPEMTGARAWLRSMLGSARGPSSDAPTTKGS